MAPCSITVLVVLLSLITGRSVFFGCLAFFLSYHLSLFMKITGKAITPSSEGMRLPDQLVQS